MLGYKNDKVAIISSNWITPKKVRKFNAVCTDAIISSDFISQEIIVEKDEESETVQNEKQEPVVKSQEAVNVTKIAEAALLSSQKGIPIYLDLK
jgi:UDP-N-acetylglucosamine 3-dehydrogenase